MTPAIAGGLALALAATVALDAGFVLQQLAAAKLRPLSLKEPRLSVLALVGARRWVLGFVLGLGGWGLYLAALTIAPLSLVQSVAAGGVAIVVLLIAIARHARPSGREAAGAAFASAGLVALVASVAVAPGVPAPRAPTIAIAIVLSLLAAAALAAGRRGTAAAAGLAAGLLYGGGDVASKLLLAGGPLEPARIVGSGWLYATLGAHLGAFAFLQRSFQRGDAVASIGTMTAATNLVPIVAGVAVLGDPMPLSPLLAGLRLAAFAACVAGAWLLSASRPGERPWPDGR
jgi:hypothetical protein